MRIINVMPEPKHMSYASTAPGGRTLRPGDSTPELPFERLLIPLVRADVEKGFIQIKLNDEDRKFIDWMLEEDARAIKLKEHPKRERQRDKPEDKPRKGGKAREEARKQALAGKGRPPHGMRPHTSGPGGTGADGLPSPGSVAPGQPDLSSVPSDTPTGPESPSMVSVGEDEAEGADLAGLRAQNARTKDIQGFMKGRV